MQSRENYSSNNLKTRLGLSRLNSIELLFIKLSELRDFIIPFSQFNDLNEIINYETVIQ